MAQLPVLPLYTDAFVADTQHLNPAEIGAYLLLLMAAWRTPTCSLPNDDKMLQRITRMDGRVWKKSKSVLMAFWESKDGISYIQKRLRIEHEKALQNKAAKQSNSKQRKIFKNKETAGSTDGSKKDPPINDGSELEGSKGDPRGNTPYPYPYPDKKEEESVPDATPYDLADAEEKSQVASGQETDSNSQPSAEQKLLRLDELFPGSGAHVVNLSRFTAWERWGYDWHMDIEPTLMAIAEQNGPGWLPRKLDYFDEPIREAFQARVQGRPGRRRSGEKRLQDYTDEDMDRLLAEARAEADAARARSMAQG
jgi:uncharacterized protein YdaU (DUF1376 family)